MKRRSVEGQLWRLLQQVVGGVLSMGWGRSRAQHLAKLAGKRPGLAELHIAN